MKIITRCVINWDGEVVEEESFEYIGPIAECKGGGTSGKVDYPDYMKAAHEDWLTESGTDSIEKSVTECMNDAIGASPWATQLAYDPDADIATYEASIAAFAAILAGLSDTVDWAALMTQAITSVGAKYTATAAGITAAGIAASVTAFGDNLDDEITANTLPRFRRGMQDINAVVSSAFPIGEAIIEAFKNRDIAKFDADLRLRAAELEVAIEEMNLKSDIEYEKMYLEGTSQMLRLRLQRIAWEEGYVRTVIEANRIKIVAKKEENDVNMEIDKDDALWDLECFQYGSNVMASISGGTSGSGKPSKTASAIGGALSGAAAGAQIGSVIPGIGTGVGAAIGAGVGLLGGIFS